MQFFPKHLTLFQVLHFSPEMPCQLVPTILFFPFLAAFSSLAALQKQWESLLTIQLKAIETTGCQIEKLKQKLFLHTEVLLLRRKEEKTIVYHSTITKLKH